MTKLCNGAKIVIFLHPVFAASRVQHVSDLHSKFALGPQHVSKYGRHPRKIEEERNHRMKI